MRFFHLCFLAGSLVIPLAAAPNERPRDLETLITAAMTYNPAVRAAEHRFRRALAQYRGEKGFFDPQFAAATGVADEIRPVPGVPNGVTNPAEAVSAEAGIDKAFAPGFYAGVGATERRHWNAVDGRDVYQTLIGAQLRVPLWRDFAFREQTLAERQAWASCAAAYSQFIEVRQQIRREVTLAYIDLQEAHALVRAGKSAFERVGDLQREARELVRLQVVPEYQLNQARLEVNLREEELLASREVLKVAAVELKQLTGIEISDALALSTSSFVDWAQTIVIRDDMPPTEAYARRGAWQQLANNIQASEAGVTLAREQLKPNIYLKTSVTYQGESFTDSFGDDALIDDDKVSGAVQLIYSQPLGYRRERAELAAEKAATSALREQQRALELRISSRLEANKIAFEISQKRLEIATRAADAAQATLEAEAERFRLGEGRSRQVLDAEKDLTATIRLQARNAARVLRAQTEHAFEAGYPETQ